MCIRIGDGVELGGSATNRITLCFFPGLHCCVRHIKQGSFNRNYCPHLIQKFSGKLNSTATTFILLFLTLKMMHFNILKENILDPNGYALMNVAVQVFPKYFHVSLMRDLMFSHFLFKSDKLRSLSKYPRLYI